MEKKEGIVLKSIDYQENSKIIYCITNQGIDSVIVKGANHLKGHTALFTQEMIKIEYEKKKERFLVNGKIIDSYVSIRTDFNKLQSVLKIMEICYVLGDHINNFQTFYQFLNQILDLISKTKDHQLLEILFRTKILYLLGVAPIFKKCVSCQSTTNLVGFAFDSGGMKCKNCMSMEDFIYPNDVIHMVQSLYGQKLSTLEKDLPTLNVDIKRVNHFLDLYYEQYLGFKSKVEKVLKHFE